MFNPLDAPADGAPRRDGEEEAVGAAIADAALASVAGACLAVWFASGNARPNLAALEGTVGKLVAGEQAATAARGTADRPSSSE